MRLKDQVDEYRHAAEKLNKTENVMEKYKKKLEESAEMRKKVKVRWSSEPTSRSSHRVN